ncbi:MAG: hypothetical protein JSV65_19575 [Armatimonadota bacterium]|nr:MAG: hypothetical protein JSV65_19575 [Armatimonadota bacterium]
MSSDGDDSTETTCHYHPGRAAFVRCGACGKPLCPECVNHGPVGTRCIECMYGIEIQPVSRRRRFAAGAAAVATALAAGSALGYFGWLNWLTGILLGLLVGHVARTMVRRILAPSVQAAAGIAAALGAFSGAVAGHARLLAEAGAPASLSFVRAANSVGVGDWGLAGLLAAGAAIYWVWRG